MKKLLLLLFIPLMSCDMSSTGVVGVIMSDNDVEEYSGTEAEDELTELVLEPVSYTHLTLPTKA